MTIPLDKAMPRVALAPRAPLDCLYMAHDSSAVAIPSGETFNDQWLSDQPDTCPAGQTGVLTHHWRYTQAVSCQNGVTTASTPVASVAAPDTNTCAFIPKTSCTEITTPGTYKLGANLQNASTSNYCINIHDVTNVQLDCQGYSIRGLNGIRLSNVKNFGVTNCTVIGDQGLTMVTAVNIEGSQNGTLSYNTLGEISSNRMYLVNVTRSNDLNIQNNLFISAYQQNYSSRNNISNNTFKSPLTTYPGNIIASCIISNLGSSNTISHNNIDGRAVGVEVSISDAGADDGILVQDETDTVISDNIIKNVWDVGVEWVGTLNRVSILRNQISNALYGGIGGWYWAGLMNSTISFNTVDTAPALFQIFRIFGLRPANWDGQGALADQGIYFTNNRFESNVLQNPTYYGTSGAYVSTNIPVMTNMGYAVGNPGPLPGSMDPRADQYFLTNNVFINNNFSSVTKPPNFGYNVSPPQGLVIDGGGNRCNTAYPAGAPWYPLVCN